MRFGKWKISVGFGWFKGNTPVGLKLVIFDVVEDYPSGWASIICVGLFIGKLEVSIGAYKA